METIPRINLSIIRKITRRRIGGRGQRWKVSINKKGSDTAADVDKINDIVKTQLDVLFRLGNVGRFVAMDLLEKIFSMGSIISSNIAQMTDEETKKYKTFLENELKKINEQKPKKKGKQIKIE